MDCGFNGQREDILLFGRTELKPAGALCACLGVRQSRVSTGPCLVALPQGQVGWPGALLEPVVAQGEQGETGREVEARAEVQLGTQRLLWPVQSVGEHPGPDLLTWLGARDSVVDWVRWGSHC